MNRQVENYFIAITKHIKSLLSINIPIYPLNHKMFLCEEEDILGCCHRIKADSGETIGYIITIDEDYITACYYGRQTQYSLYSDKTLMETICHEIAHLYYWNHDKDHEQLTKELFKFTKDKIFYKNF